MNEIIFTIGSWNVTLLQAGLIGFGLVVLLLAATLIVLLRDNTSRTEEAARTATEALRGTFVQQIAERDGRIRDLDGQVRDLNNRNATLQADGAATQARMGEQSKHAEENIKRLEKSRQQMTDEFKLIANDALKLQGETFSKQNREQVDQLLKPLQTKITEFHTGLVQDRAAMGERIQALTENSMRMAAEANNLTRALKGNSQTQGAWGEMILSTILERSGLREGEEYFVQQSHNADDGSRVRTDVEVLMPNQDRLVIDSKVSLTAFEAFTNTEEDDEKQRFLREHIASIRGHIKTLGSKDYARHAKSRVDFVLMFIPIEGAFALAINEDPGLIEYALSEGVSITTPTTLMSALRAIRNVWDIEKRHRNAEEIAQRAGALYEKVAGFLTSMEKLGQHIGRAQVSFDEAKGQLSSGRGNVVRQVEMLRDLGAKTSKQLPKGWEDKDDDTPGTEQLELSPPDMDPQDLN